eukprot:m.233810 g.233810  ORF g.233810 m.233810 type:complete len:563 (+) comp19315_c0_seq1:61-1749(+)
MGGAQSQASALAPLSQRIALVAGPAMVAAAAWHARFAAGSGDEKETELQANPTSFLSLGASASSGQRSLDESHAVSWQKSFALAGLQGVSGVDVVGGLFGDTAPSTARRLQPRPWEELSFSLALQPVSSNSLPGRRAVLAANSDEKQVNPEEALENAIKLFGKSHPDTAKAYYIAARAIYRTNLDKAIQYGQAALEIQHKVLGEDNLATVNSRFLLGQLYAKKQQWDRAITLLKEALAGAKRVQPGARISQAAILDDLGDAYAGKEDWDHAIECHQAAARLFDELGEENARVGFIHESLCSEYRRKGEFAQAVAHGVKAIALFTADLGKKHPQVANAHFNIAIVYKQNKEYGKAIDHLKKAIKIFTNVEENRRILGDIADCYGMLGNCYEAKDDSDEALAAYLKMYQYNERAHGSLHPTTVDAAQRIARLYVDKQQYREAIEYLEKVLAAFTTLMGDKEISVADVYGKLGFAHAGLGQIKAALIYVKKDVEIRLAVQGEKHTDTAAAMFLLAVLYADDGDITKAREYALRAQKVVKKLLPADHQLAEACAKLLGEIDKIQAK